MGLLDFLTGKKKKEQITHALESGAIIIDVRTVQEFDGGHFPGSKNIPLHMLPTKLGEIRNWKKPVVVVCASGMRSGQAKILLTANGIETYNAGSWMSLSGY
ncbi:MAG: rhodanese-like domain-containing protein [Sphingobacteriales bacterium]|nr:MAG: rhodanese-like domain-containing protein [Sphingobacteriales bacterium]